MGETTNASAYRLHAPDRRMYDPSTIEQIFAQALLGPEANRSIGLYLGAQGDSAASNASYLDTLAQVNQQQQAIAQQRMASDERNAQYRLAGNILEHPGQAYTLDVTRSMLAPDALEHSAQMAVDDAVARQAAGVLANARAAQSFAEAGVMPPQRTPFDMYGRPLGVRTQGTPLDVMTAGMRASAAGGALAQDRLALGWARFHEMRRNNINAQVGREARLMFPQAVTENRDAGGNLIGYAIRPGPDAARVQQFMEQRRQELLSQVGGTPDTGYTLQPPAPQGARSTVPTAPTGPTAPTIPTAVAPPAPAAQTEPRLSQNDAIAQLRRMGVPEARIGDTLAGIRRWQAQGRRPQVEDITSGRVLQ